MKRIVSLSLGLILLFSACAQQRSSNPVPLPPDFTPVALPAAWTSTPSGPTPIPEWKVFTGGGVEVALPSRFEGGDPEASRERLLELIRSLGPEYERYLEAVEQNPTGMVLMAFDLESSASTMGVTRREIPPEMTLEEYMNGLLSALVEEVPGTSVIERSVVEREKDQAGRVILEFETGDAVSRQLTFVFLKAGKVWTLSYASGRDRFDEMLPTYELSMLTFKYSP